MNDALTEQQRVIEKVMAENEQLRAENAVLVEALQFINHECMHSYENCPTRDQMRIKATKALTNTSEQAKALLEIVTSAKELNRNNHNHNYLNSYEINLKEALAAYDKLKEGEE